MRRCKYAKSLICSCSDKRSWEIFWGRRTTGAVSKQELLLRRSELPQCLQNKKNEGKVLWFCCCGKRISSIFPFLTSPPKTRVYSASQASPGT